MLKWKLLEQRVANLLGWDKGVLPKGSGSSKKEEDISGRTILVQCKQTEQINTSILEKDVTRLLEACKLQDKFPLFVTETSNYTIVSFPLNDMETETLVQDALNMISWKKLVSKLLSYLTQSDNFTIAEVNTLNKEIKDLKKRKQELEYFFKSNIDALEHKAKIIYDNITMCNLFEGDLNV